MVIYNDQLRQNRKDLIEYTIPMFLINHKVYAPQITSVFVDIEKAVYERVSDYLARGKNKIGIIQDRKNNQACKLMVEGAKKAYKEHGLEFDGYLMIPSEYHTSYAYLSEHFKDNNYDLVIAYRDSQAFATINAASENNIKVPDEMEVICVIDTKYNSMVRPQVSSFSLPSYDLGAVAMRVLTKMLKNDSTFDHEIELSYLYTTSINKVNYFYKQT